MLKEPAITAEDFQLLLSWLNPERAKAELKYEQIRRSLTFYFIKRGVYLPEELVDVTLSRVTAKAGTLLETYHGDPALYFYGVARNVLKEYLRQQEHHATHVFVSTQQPPEYVYKCLEDCVGKLPADERELLLRYYDEAAEGAANFRHALARQLGISLNSMRVKIHRLRERLRDCIAECRERHEAASPY